MIYLLDTNICVAIIRKRPQQVLTRLMQQPPGTIGVSVITAAELSFGAAKSAQPEQNIAALDQFLLPLEVYAFDHLAARTYGQIRAELERGGIPIGSMDLLIAAHALSLDLMLVTNNTRHFARIPNLRLEDWMNDQTL